MTWEDKITNIRILEQAKSVSIHSMLRLQRLRWLGLVSRMPHDHIPQEIMYSELASPQTSIQGCLQARPEANQHRLEVLGRSCTRQRRLACYSEVFRKANRRAMATTERGKTSEKESKAGTTKTGFRLCLFL